MPSFGWSEALGYLRNDPLLGNLVGGILTAAFLGGTGLLWSYLRQSHRRWSDFRKSRAEEITRVGRKAAAYPPELRRLHYLILVEAFSAIFFLICALSNAVLLHLRSDVLSAILSAVFTGLMLSCYWPIYRTAKMLRVAMSVQMEALEAARVETINGPGARLREVAPVLPDAAIETDPTARS